MAKRKITVKKKEIGEDQLRRKYLMWSVLIPLLLVALYFGVTYKYGIAYYVKSIFQGDYAIEGKKAGRYDAHNVDIMSTHADKVFGIDISQYQGAISWLDIHTINDSFPIDFIFIRSTMGEESVDRRFAENWKSAASRAKIRGAYHYFRPNENSLKQARNFIRTVQLSPGDLPPVLDIEERPRHQSMDSLTVGLKRWLHAVEQHYGVQPILYSGDSYYNDYLHQEFGNYVLWIANYNLWVKNPKEHWDFWQFSEKGTVRGIKGNVDLNLFNGDIEALEALAIPYP